MPDPADRNLQRSALLPRYLVEEFKEGMQSTRLAAPVFTRVSVTSGSSFALSGTNAPGRVGIRVHNYTAFNAANWLNIGPNAAAVMAATPIGERIFGQAGHDASVFIPIASGTVLVMSSSGATQTVALVEW